MTAAVSDVNKAFLTGEAKYMSTGRGFVIVHDRFLSQYCRYLQSHFAPAFEIMLLLIVSCFVLVMVLFTAMFSC